MVIPTNLDLPRKGRPRKLALYNTHLLHEKQSQTYKRKLFRPIGNNASNKANDCNVGRGAHSINLPSVSTPDRAPRYTIKAVHTALSSSRKLITGRIKLAKKGCQSNCLYSGFHHLAPGQLSSPTCFKSPSPSVRDPAYTEHRSVSPS